MQSNKNSKNVKTDILFANVYCEKFCEMFIDTHAHLYLPQFDEDREEVMQRAKDFGIEKIYLPNIDSDSIALMLKMENDYPQRCYAMMGLHPCSVKMNYEEELDVVENWLGERKFCSVGEIGIDLYWDTTFFEQQKAAFIRQMNWAKDLGIPIVIHSRESTSEIIELVGQEQDGRLKGIFHCFGGSEEEAKHMIDLGFFLGIGGVVTYKNGGLDKSLKNIDLKHLVLETDSPYLTPVPFRGKRNESAYIHHIATRLASIKETDLARVEEITTENALTIFGT